jgi:hypothetical protein
MAGSVNKVILVGNLGRDPEVRTLPSGDRVVSFSLATTESWRDKNTGERKDRTEWHNISIFNENLGKIAARAPKSISRASWRRANTPTRMAISARPRTLCCNVIAAS